MSIEIAKSSATIIGSSNMQKSTEEIARSVQRLSTGKRVDSPDVSPIALIEGEKFRLMNSMLEDGMDAIRLALSLARTTDGAYKSIYDDLTKVVSLASQSSGALQETTRTAYQASADQLIAQVQSTARNTNFNGLKLIDGSFSSSPVLEDKVKNAYALGIKVNTALAGTSVSAGSAGGVGVARSETITCAAVVADDTITIDGVTFAFKAAATTPYEIKLGATDAETARNAVEVLRNSSVGKTKKYAFDVTNAVITAARISTGNVASNFLTSSSTVTLAHSALVTNGSASGAGALALDRLVDNKDFIGTLPSVQLLGSGFRTGADAVNYALNFGHEDLRAYVGPAITATADADAVLDALPAFITQNFDKVNEVVAHPTNNAMSWTGGDGTNAATTVAWSAAQVNEMKKLAYQNFGTAYGAKYVIDLAFTRLLANASNSQATAVADIGIAGGNVATATAGAYAIADHRAATYTVTVGDHTYDGVLFVANSTGAHATASNVNNNKVYFVDRDNHNSRFEIEFAGYAQAITSAGDAQTILTAMNTELAKLTILQTHDIKVDNSHGNVKVNDVVIGSTAGLTASFKNSVFTGQSFDDLAITKATNGDLTFTATINSVDYTYAAAFASDLVTKGTRLNLADASGNILSVQLGMSQDLNLSTDSYRSAVADEFKKAFGFGREIQYLTGVTSDDTIGVSLDDASTDKLFLVDGVVKTIDLSSNAAAIASRDVLVAALTKISSFRAKIGALMQRFQSKFDTMNTSYQNQKAAESNMLNTNQGDESSRLDGLIALKKTSIASMLKAQRTDSELNELFLR